MKLSTVKAWGFGWLDICETTGNNQKETVLKVRCSLCTKYEHHVCSVRNFQRAWVDGTTNVKKDAVVTHKNGDPHKKAEYLERNKFLKENGQSAASQTVIGRSLNKLRESDNARIKKLFDIAFLVAKEEMAFTKFVPLAKLERKHGVDIGETYLTDHKCAEFIESIAEIYEDELNDSLNKVKFFSLLIDGSTDSANKEKEMMYVLYLHPSTARQTVRFFSLKEIPQSLHGNALGLVQTMKKALEDHALSEKLNNMVGLGVDGASVNMGQQGGVHALLKTVDKMNWLVAIHCISHRLELSVKDSLEKQAVFKEIDGMLLTLYLMYKNSPKKMRQLAGIAIALECTVSNPVKSSGTRWITHKVQAMEWVSKNYQVIMEHLQHMSADNSFRKDEQAKFKGYYESFRDAKFPLFISYYLEILTPAALLSQQFQKEDIDVVSAIRQVKTFFRIINEMIDSPDLLISIGRVKSFCDSLHPLENSEQPAARTCTRAGDVGDDGQHFTFRSVPLTYLERAKRLLTNHNVRILQAVFDCFKTRFATFVESDLLTSAVKILDTEMYPQAESSSFQEFGRDAVKTVFHHFESILVRNGCDIDKVLYEWEYVKEFVADTVLHSMDYRGAWAKVFLSSKATELQNVLSVIEILLVLPVSNACVERGFSCMKRVHTDWRNCLTPDRVEQLMRIVLDGPESAVFDPQAAVDKWSEKCIRRPNTQPYGSAASSGQKRKLESEVLSEVMKNVSHQNLT